MSVELQFQCLRFIKQVDLDFSINDAAKEPNLFTAGSAADAALEYLTEFESQKPNLPLRVKTFEQMTLALQKIANSIKDCQIFSPYQMEDRSKVFCALQKAEALRAKAKVEQIQQRLPFFLKWLSLPIRWALDRGRKVEPVQVADHVIRHNIDKIYTRKQRLSELDFYLDKLEKNISFQWKQGFQIEELFQHALLYHDIALAEPLVQKAGVNTQHKEGKTFLHLAVEANRADFVQWLLALHADPNIKNEKGLTVYDIARDNHRLTLCRLLRGSSFFQEAASMLGQKYASHPKDLYLYLIRCFLNSEPGDVRALINALKNNEVFAEPLCQAEEYIKTSGTLIVRFPSQADQDEMFKHYGTSKGYQNYEEQQHIFGMQRFQIYSKVLTGILQENWSLDDVYAHLAVSRPDVKPNPDDLLNVDGKHFAQFRTDNRTHHLRTLFNDNSSRYKPYKHLSMQVFAKLLKQLKANPEQCDLQIKSNGYDFHIVFVDESGKEILLTQNDPFGERAIELGQPKWNHTLAENTLKIRPILSKLFDEIKGHAKNKDLPFNQIKQKIALFYWLACHAIVICRGNSQYSLEIQKLLFEMNGYAITPLSHKYALPDCVALCMTFREFFDKYYDDLFEITPIAPIAPHSP